MHEQLLEYRLEMKKRMQKQGLEDVALLQNKKTLNVVDAGSMRLLTEGKSQSSVNGVISDDLTSNFETLQKSWDEKWSIVASRTGINDPNIFFRRILNRYITCQPLF
jgi:hypothetical protein